MKPLTFINPDYKIDEYGGVFNKKGKRLKPHKHTGKGCTYLRYTLYRDGKKKNYRMHRLVAMAYISNPENLEEVHHKDENTFNNHVDNLEWVTGEENKWHRG